MALKTRITSLITTFILLCSLLTVGVFAVKNTTFNVGGDIIFNVQGIEAEVKLEELTNASLKDQTYNTGADTDKLKTFELDNDMTASQVQACYESWSGLDMKFDSEADVLLKIRITNKTEIADNLLKVDMSATFGSANNCTISVDKATATIFPGEYEIFTITFSITNKEYSANIENFAVKVDMSQYIPQLSDVQVYHDEENNYYYIEMGTYNGNPVRWRYVADVTNGVNYAISYESTKTAYPFVGCKGMFVLESDIFTADSLNQNSEAKDGVVEFLSSDMYSGDYHTTNGFTDVPANDYAASNLRAYLKGTTNIAGQDVGSLMGTINLDITNEIYQKIQGRTLTDLYSTISLSGQKVDLPNQFEETDEDKFWIMSRNEVYDILQSNSCWKSPVYASKNIKGAWYWIRNKGSGKNDIQVILADASSGKTNSMTVFSFVMAVRPAFILEF